MWARRGHPFRGGPIRPEAGLSASRRAYPSQGAPVRPEASLSVPRRANSETGLQALDAKVANFRPSSVTAEASAGVTRS